MRAGAAPKESGNGLRLLRPDDVGGERDAVVHGNPDVPLDKNARTGVVAWFLARHRGRRRYQERTQS